MLRQLCEAVLDDDRYQPKNGVTHCNQAVAQIAYGMGHGGLTGLLANSIITLMGIHWREVDGAEAARLAAQDVLVVAGQKEQPHGHVAVVFPDPMQKSGSWGKDVPMLANVGKINGVMRASQAFKTEPTYFTPREVA